MSIQRWDPWRDIVSLREAMNSLLEESFVRPRAGMAAMTGGMAIDLSETDEAYTIKTTVPGAKPEDVDISILGDTLRISAEVKAEEEREGEKWLVRERRFGNFERAVTLPSNVKADEAQADFDNGVLTITLPKAEAARPRQIQVRAGAAGQEQAPKEIEVESGASEREQSEG
ncbi:MAG TPA: Hsp20/alpha crystallin family protein [Thermomicrobiales bacterium]|nr:Hsp20/alpha crystallin family protein [Thermomicrobiales bacterium]